MGFDTREETGRIRAFNELSDGLCDIGIRVKIFVNAPSCVVTAKIGFLAHLERLRVARDISLPAFGGAGWLFMGGALDFGLITATCVNANESEVGQNGSQHERTLAHSVTWAHIHVRFMLSSAIVMRPLCLPKKKWLVLAAGLMASCFLNPQPEPPGAQAEPPGHPAGGADNLAAGGGAYSAPVGGWYNTGNSQNAAGGMPSGLGNASGGAQTAGSNQDKADAGEDAAAPLDSGFEPGSASDLAE